MRTEAIIAALLLVGSVLPLATARHLSVGYEDSVGVGVDESPDDPTVNDSAYQRGLGVGCEPFESEGNLTAEAAADAATGDAFCGDLLYHEDSENLTTPSPPDQNFTTDEIQGLDISGFDVQVVNYAGSVIERWDQFWVNATWDAAHLLGEELQVTDGNETADSQEGDRRQAYHVALHYPFATHIAQQQTGTWEMNGPYSPEPFQSFAGILLDGDGQSVGPDRLRQVIENNDEIPDTAVPSICGFEPFEGFAATANIGTCSIELFYMGQGDGDLYFDGYDNECESPAYFCSPTTEGAWHGRIQCLTQCGDLSETQYEIWHWVVAPVLDLDCRAKAPGFLTTSTASAGVPYLAHDLDVYTPTASATDAASVPTTWTWSNDAADTVVDEVDATIDDLPDLPGIPDVPDTSQATTFVAKDDRVEPNAQPVQGLAETSQSLLGDEDLEREITECAALTSAEDQSTVDPWVDIVDGHARSGANLEESGTGQEAQVFFYDGRGFGGEEVLTSAFLVDAGDDTGLYLDSNERRDSSNREGPTSVFTQGKVGMFTDKDDDGEYDQNFFGAKNDAEDVEEEGAYQMLWDMWVEFDDQGEPSPAHGQGCTVVGGHSHPAIMEDAGYGPHTGLAQLIYQRQPTVFYDPVDLQRTEYPAGDNIYVLGSQSVKKLWTEDPNDGRNQLDAAIDDAVLDLKAHGQQVADVEPDVQTPGDELGLASDFQNQCREPTGGFSSALSFVHDCSIDCSGDTIATVYSFELNRTDGSLGGGEDIGRIPLFSPQNITGPYDFDKDDDGQETWTDVDPFDGDVSRNDKESSAPPTGEQ